MDKIYKQHGKFFKYLRKMLRQARVLLAKTALPKSTQLAATCCERLTKSGRCQKMPKRQKSD
jgi:hypothetical protein